ncbi:MAG: hypothetical protein KGJ07_01535 [Patescibacteria group bacterium]|nr:hypothetical protein [Patescibacteria group bacterium]
MTPVEAFFNQPFVLKIIEFFITIGTLGGLVIKSRIPNDGLTKRDLFKMIEEKDRQLERLTIEKHAHRMRYEHMKKQHKGKTCK